MNEGRTVFAQLMDFISRHEFNKCVRRYHGDKHVRQLCCHLQFLIMSFAQLAYRESLRDIETCMKALGPRLYHSGFRRPVPRSTLADANEKRDWRIFSDFAHVLIAEAITLYRGESFGAELESTAYALDSSTIDLCLSLFTWVRKKLLIKHRPYTILQILSITLFEKTPILQALSEHLIMEQKDDQHKQLVLKGF